MGDPNKRGKRGDGKRVRARSEGAISDTERSDPPSNKHVRFDLHSGSNSGSQATPPFQRGMQCRNYIDVLSLDARRSASTQSLEAQHQHASPAASVDKSSGGGQPLDTEAAAANEKSDHGQSSRAALGNARSAPGDGDGGPSDRPSRDNSSTGSEPVQCAQPPSRKGKEQMTVQQEVEELYAREELTDLARAEFESLRQAARYREMPTEVLFQLALEHAASIKSPASGHDSELRPPSTDQHRGSAPPSARGSSKLSPSSARPSPSENFADGTGIDEGDKLSIGKNQGFSGDDLPGNGNNTIQYLRKGTIHSMPRIFSNAKEETGDNPIVLTYSLHFQYRYLPV